MGVVYPEGPGSGARARPQAEAMGSGCRGAGGIYRRSAVDGRLEADGDGLVGVFHNGCVGMNGRSSLHGYLLGLVMMLNKLPHNCQYVNTWEAKYWKSLVKSIKNR